MSTDIKYIKAKSKEDYEIVKGLVSEYFSLYKNYLGTQDFDREVQTIPDRFSAPDVCFIYALDGENVPLGCVGMKKFDDVTCEMSRLYVKSQSRGSGVGYNLIKKFINEARRKSYKQAFLDTVPDFSSAVKLYNSLGFERIKPYYDSPIKDPIYMKIEI